MWYIDPPSLSIREENEMLITTFTNELFTDWNFKYSPKLFPSSLFSISKYIKDPHAPNIYTCTHCTNHVASSFFNFVRWTKPHRYGLPHKVANRKSCSGWVEIIVKHYVREIVCRNVHIFKEIQHKQSAQYKSRN